mmetsp:Transcript_39898/g.95485  ORF Transcript_39898/g.95485 Transcript_39898/m.95485 type:complete len:229 (+) Transcript_39898:756-1442(+)
MINLPEHASSDFVAELSELMSDHAWWDAVEEKRVDLLNDRAKEKAGRDRSVAMDGDRAPAAEEKPEPRMTSSERNQTKVIGEHHSELLVLAARVLRVRPMQLKQRLLYRHAHRTTPAPHPSSCPASHLQTPLTGSAGVRAGLPRLHESSVRLPVYTHMHPCRVDAHEPPHAARQASHHADGGGLCSPRASRLLAHVRAKRTRRDEAARARAEGGLARRPKGCAVPDDM